MTAAIRVERFLDRPGEAPAGRNTELSFSRGKWRAVAGASGAGRLAVHAPVNAHDHGYGIRTLDFACMDDALEPWIAGLRVRPRTDPYLEALVAFGRLARGGCGATVHCHNSLNADSLVDEAGAVVRAARECGIALALSCPLLDESPWVYGGVEALRPNLAADEWRRLQPLLPRYSPVEEQIAAVLEIARLHAGEGIDVQLGPIGPQWASDRLLEAIADASARTGLRVHMHLLESPRQRRWLDRRFPDGVVEHLDRIGFLSPRLAVAHGVQLRPAECERLAERGVIVVSNPAANLRLRSGVAPLADFRAAGLDFALGLDGTGFDDDQDIWREMRLAWLLHGGRDLDAAVSPAEVFGAVLDNGSKVVNRPRGQDLVVVDYAALSSEALFDDVDEAQLLINRMSARHVTDLFVGDRHVLSDRVLTGFDFEAALRELVASARADAPRLGTARAQARLLAGVIRRHYRSEAASGG